MTRHPFQRLVICYVPAIDVRVLDAGLCAYVAGLIAQHSWVRFRTQPATDLMATLFTGTWPHEHGLWGPKLRPDWADRSPAQKLIDLLPDHVNTTAQCLAHMLHRPMDLATMPPRRRRRFDRLRFNIKYISDLDQVVQPINGTDTVFTAVGARQCRFAYMDDYWRLDETLAEVGNGGYRLEMAEIHCLDHLLHWNRPGTDQVRDYHRGIDDFVKRLHAKCRDNDIGFMLLSDHGMEPVREVVDLRAELKALDVPERDYEVFLENTKATFWFHTGRAHAEITAALGSSPSGVLLSWQDMARYDLHFVDNGYGDAYFCAHPGLSFFPNDFHQPLASAALSLMDRQQRQRLRVPWHQADHGYLPDCDGEIGFMVVPDDSLRPTDDWMRLIDFAPSVLGLLGEEPAPAMRGRMMFAPAEGQRRAS